MYRGQWHPTPLQSRHLGTSLSSPNHPHGSFLNLIDGLNISSFSKVILVLGKVRSHRVPNLGCSKAESPGDLMFHQKLCRRCDTWAGSLSWQSCQSPLAHRCGLLNHPNSFCRGMFKLTTKFDADLLISHCECEGHTVHVLTQWRLPLSMTVQWSCRYSHTRIPVCSPWLPGYIDVAQTILIILTMVGLFLDRPCICLVLFLPSDCPLHCHIGPLSFPDHE